MAASLTVLVTGFEPFDADTVNPSWEVARALDGWHPVGAQVHAVQLSCIFGRAMTQLTEAIDRRQPQLVICLGLAGGRNEVSLERVAINIDDARIPDNAGQQPVDHAIVADGPAAYFSTLPIKAIVRDLRAAGMPGAVSNTAGTFVCNHVFYGLMHQLAQRLGEVRGGFIHLPYLPEQAALHPETPTLPLDVQIQAIRKTIETALVVDVDVRETAGKLH